MSLLDLDYRRDVLVNVACTGRFPPLSLLVPLCYAHLERGETA